MIYIPLLETLQSMLENDAVMSKVRLYPMLHSKVSVNVHCVLRGCCQVIVSGCLAPENINGVTRKVYTVQNLRKFSGTNLICGYCLLRCQEDTLVPVGFWKTIVTARCIRSTTFTRSIPVVCNSIFTMMQRFVIRWDQNGRYTNLICTLFVCLHTCMYNVFVQDSSTLVQSCFQLARF